MNHLSTFQAFGGRSKKPISCACETNMVVRQPGSTHSFRGYDPSTRYKSEFESQVGLRRNRSVRSIKSRDLAGDPEAAAAAEALAESLAKRNYDFDGGSVDEEEFGKDRYGLLRTVSTLSNFSRHQFQYIPSNQSLSYSVNTHQSKTPSVSSQNAAFPRSTSYASYHRHRDILEANEISNNPGSLTALPTAPAKREGGADESYFGFPSGPSYHHPDEVDVAESPRHLTSELKSYKKEVKEKLKNYDEEFRRKHGRRPNASEKEPIRHLYEMYHIFKNEINLREQLPADIDGFALRNEIARPPIDHELLQNGSSHQEIPNNVKGLNENSFVGVPDHKMSEQQRDPPEEKRDNLDAAPGQPGQGKSSLRRSISWRRRSNRSKTKDLRSESPMNRTRSSTENHENFDEIPRFVNISSREKKRSTNLLTESRSVGSKSEATKSMASKSNASRSLASKFSWRGSKRGPKLRNAAVVFPPVTENSASIKSKSRRNYAQLPKAVESGSKKSKNGFQKRSILQSPRYSFRKGRTRETQEDHEGSKRTSVVPETYDIEIGVDGLAPEKEFPPRTIEYTSPAEKEPSSSNILCGELFGIQFPKMIQTEQQAFRDTIWKTSADRKKESSVQELRKITEKRYLRQPLSQQEEHNSNGNAMTNGTTRNILLEKVSETTYDIFDRVDAYWNWDRKQGIPRTVKSNDDTDEISELSFK